MKQILKRCGSCLLLCCLLAVTLPTQASAASFKDVPTGHWAATSIRRCADLGFFQGKTATTFGMGQSMTRGAAVVVLDRFFGWEPVDVTLPYEDVPANAWYADALRSAYAQGVVTTQTEDFRPADAVSREELAVMLIRALDYGAIAGVAAELPETFSDVRSNEGYIAMARDLGLVTGIRTDYFSPRTYASREQVAVILMRLYDELHKEGQVTLGIADEAEDVKDFNIAAVAAASLNNTGTLRELLSSKKVSDIRTAAKARGVHEVLYVTAGANFLSKRAAEATQTLVKAVTEGSYAGLMLEVKDVKASQREALTAFAEGLNSALGSKTLTLVLPAPSRFDETEPSAGGYDYAALGKAADRLVVRVAQLAEDMNGFPVTPLEPMEEVYWGLSRLKESGVDLAHVSVMLTTTGSHYSGTRDRGDMTAEEIRKLLEDENWVNTWSDRYGCACLEHPDDNEAVWYLDGRAAEERLQMAQLFGTEGFCLSDPAAADAELLTVLQ